MKAACLQGYHRHSVQSSIFPIEGDWLGSSAARTCCSCQSYCRASALRSSINETAVAAMPLKALRRLIGRIEASVLTLGCVSGFFLAEELSNIEPTDPRNSMSGPQARPAHTIWEHNTSTSITCLVPSKSYQSYISAVH